MSKFNKNRAFLNENIKKSIENSKKYNKNMINYYEKKLEMLKHCLNDEEEVKLEVEAITYVLKILNEIDKKLKI